MIKAVVFDFFGTLARHRPEAGEPEDLEPATATFSTRYAHRLAGLGYQAADPAVIKRHIDASLATLEHDKHSVSCATFERYQTQAYALLVRELGVRVEHETQAIAALRDVDRSAVIAYDDVPDCLSWLATQNLKAAVCSNWGWRLDPYLEQAGLSHHLAAAITSARVGARKPHERTYSAALAAIGEHARDAVFVGDSWDADVAGPLQAGFDMAVHLDRGGSPPGEPHDRAVRITTLRDLPAAMRDLALVAELR